MSEDVSDTQLEAVALGGIMDAARIARDDRRFFAWLLAALLIHAALLVGVRGAKPRQIGDASGVDDAISISLVTESELRGDATVADAAPGEPGMPAPPARQPVPPPQPAPEAQQQPTPPDAAQAAAEPPPPEPVKPPEEKVAQPPKAEPAPQEAAKTELKPTMDVETADAPAPDWLAATKAVPAPANEKSAEEPAKPAEAKESKTKDKAPAKPPEAKPRESKSKETKTAKLDMAVPPSMQSPSTQYVPSGSRGAGVERPPGITRSGANDAFARGVIRALQQTMPQLSNTRGRVKVRITLNRNGNLVSTEVLMPSNVAGLDQSVVFATRQSSFPLPPYNAVPADLIFVVTYIYR